MNLRDSGFRVTVGLREGSPSREEALREGLEVASPAEAVKGADLVALLLPDMAQPEVFVRDVAPNLRPEAAVLFAHGFNVRFGLVETPSGHDVVLVAPKGPGDLVRETFRAGAGVPCLVAVHRDASGRARERAEAYAAGIGGARAGLLETTFAEETETDLFGEQAVLCGGVAELVKAGYETLVEAGYRPEVAYFECLHELKLIVDLLHRGGLGEMRRVVSETAKYGDLTRGRRVVDARVRASMREVLEEVRSGAFAREWVAEHRAGRPEYGRRLREEAAHPMEAVGARLRARMPWLGR